MSLPSRIRIVLPIVPEGTASDRVDDNKENEEDDVYDGHLLPVMLEIGKNTGLAGLAIVAKNFRIILPSVAVRVAGNKISRLGPNSFALVSEVAGGRRLAASRLLRSSKFRPIKFRN